MDSTVGKMAETLSIVQGSSEPPLIDETVGRLIDKQVQNYDNRKRIIFPSDSAAFSFKELSDRSRLLAKALTNAGLKHGDTAGIFALNVYQYAEVFFAAGRIGCPSVFLNATYTPAELLSGVQHTSCKVLFIPISFGTQSLEHHLRSVSECSSLTKIIFLSDSTPNWTGQIPSETYNSFINSGQVINDNVLSQHERRVGPHDVLNIQFTSGTTSSPKACLISHHNMINNAVAIANTFQMGPSDILVTPMPLFHCFGINASLLTCVMAGATVIFPSPQFDPVAMIQAVVNHKATMLHGVPTMFVAMIEVANRKGLAEKINTLQKGVVGGSAVAISLMRQIESVLGMKGFGALGMTETSPGSFVCSPSAPMERRISSVGKILPHVSAKIVDPTTGKMLPRGERGELVVGGYNVCLGYLNQEEKTREVISTDENGTRWMKTGDECYIDEEGYCYITGRIKDIIIRGGENIYPGEIEGRLVDHDAVAEASVVGLKDDRMGEIVAAFLRPSESSKRPDDSEVREWVGKSLGRHKIPKHIFWLGDAGVGADFPKTGSGKHQKHILRDIGAKIVGQPADGTVSAKL